MPRNAGSGRSFLHALARIVTILLIVVVGGLLLLGLSDPVSLDALLGGSGNRPRVGLIAGHWQHDSGAVCDDGLQEVDINLAVARKVAYILRQHNYRVQVLPEYAPELNGYRADAVLAIHSDSCVEDLSGFKVARMTHSAIPEEEDRLVQALSQAYAEATGLSFHVNTITEDMRQYHALRQIAPETPGAIIECGFMGGDRYLLTQEQDRVAVGIANGLIAFVEQRRSATPTPTR